MTEQILSTADMHHELAIPQCGVEAMVVLMRARNATEGHLREIHIPNDDVRFEVFSQLATELGIIKERFEGAEGIQDFTEKYPAETKVIKVLFPDAHEQDTFIGECVHYLNTPSTAPSELELIKQM